MKQILMTIKTTLFLLVFPILLFLSCGTTQGLSKKQNYISSGQTKEEVINILGLPGNKQFKGKNEAWQYCQTGFSADLYVIVWFYNGTVTGMNTYNGYGVGSCTEFFNNINWEDAPDITIENRNR